VLEGGLGSTRRGRARAALEQVLADQVRVLGPDHPDTFGVRGTRAYWRGESGDPEVAAEETAQLLADRVRVLGPDHPRTLATFTISPYGAASQVTPKARPQASPSYSPTSAGCLGPTIPTR
jgi:hypothetical protein